jgi:dinuclear metal center YbgI/SA1388 family protein
MLVRDVYDALDRLAPFALALEWDNSGFQCGDPDSEVRAVAFALDPTIPAMEEALSQGANLLVSHHPLVFKPLKSLSDRDPSAAAPLYALRHGLSVISAHSNWDAVGVAPALAKALDIRPLGVLEAVPLRTLKLVAFVPEGHEARVADAVFAAGAGEVGEYSRCSFRAAGLGSFLPGEGANPAIGSKGAHTETPELRLEALVPRGLRDRVARALIESHPYEEPAFEFQESALPRGYGFGLIGEWDPPREPLGFLSGRLGVPAFPVAGPRAASVRRVALMPGSGGPYVEAAKKAGAELLVTGDLGHHQALLARNLGLTVAALGHHQTENPGVAALRDALSGRLGPGAKTIFIEGSGPIATWAG